ncbi:hypothetical protein [Jannaschia sp. LMIT008]|uniref:hypothetical protein n=1 Tax=Jannaschia maritima TaxID=3032585 RepID=UPI0028124F19|nr:hypothetical protein [Jannaschia sp. LMIT008]
MMTRIATLLSATALTFAAPAFAQNAGTGLQSNEGTWGDVSRPNVRIIQTDGRGAVTFDSHADGSDGLPARTAAAIAESDDPVRDAQAQVGADGVSGPKVVTPDAAQRADADASALGDGVATELRADDAATLQAGSTNDATTVHRAQEAQAATLDDDRDAARIVPDASGTANASATSDDDRTTPLGDGPDLQADTTIAGDDRQFEQGTDRAMDMATIGGTGGDAMMPGSDGTITTSSGFQFDVEEFAREMFEQGYRQGYVSGMTQMRAAAARQMMGERRQFDQFRQQANAQAQQQRALQDGQRQQPRATMQRRPDGSTVILLPQGLSAEQFIRQMNAR